MSPGSLFWFSGQANRWCSYIIAGQIRMTWRHYSHTKESVCRFSQIIDLLFHPSSLDGNKSTWLLLIFSSLISVDLQHTRTLSLSLVLGSCFLCGQTCRSQRLSSVYLGVHASRASRDAWQHQHFSGSVGNPATSHPPTRKTKSSWPVVPVSLCSVAPSMLFQISGAANHCAWLHCAHFGLDYISLTAHTLLHSFPYEA